tara:strand:+ start:158 stop:316 length:159 start_codon:yes stop_codon:yes gene_type:complete
MINGNISNNIDGKFKKVSNIGNPIPTSSWLLKNFISSRIFNIKIKDAKIAVI